MSYKFLFPCIGLAAGIYLTDVITPGYAVAAFSIAIALTIWIVLHIFSKSPDNGLRIAKFHFIWIIFLFAGIGSLDFHFFKIPYLEKEIENYPVRIQGKIENVKYFTQGDCFKLKVLSIKDSLGNPINFQNINLLLNTDGFNGAKGDVISFTAILHGINSYNKNQKYLTSLRHHGFYGFANVKFSDISKSNENLGLIDRLQDKLVRTLEKSKLNRETSNFLISVLLGDRSFLSEDIKQSLNSAGMAHVFAVSGMHVAIILSLALGLLFPLSLLGFHKSRKLIAIILVWIFVLITGSSPSTVRAAIMATLIIGAYILERKNSALNSLLAAGLIILLIDPLTLWDLGFQLSFICVASIILFTAKLNPVDHHRHPVTYKITNLILITLVASLSTFVLVSHYFGSVSLLFLPANIILLPFLPLFIGMGIIYMILLSFRIDLNWFSYILDKYLLYWLDSARMLSLNGESSFSFRLPEASVFIWILGLIGLAIFVNKNSQKFRRHFLTISILLLGLSLALPLFINPSSSTLKFNHSFTKIEAQLIRDNNHTILNFPRKNISSTEYENFHILSVDNRILPDSLEILKLREKKKFNYLVIGPDADMAQIREIIESFRPDKIILHPGIGKNMKRDLTDNIDESYLNLIHPLGELGSLEINLED